MDNKKICDLPPNYKPSLEEDYMNDNQLEYFRQKLTRWKEELEKGDDEVIKFLQEEGKGLADAADRASSEIDLTYELRSKERARKLITKIDAALGRITNRTYGYCESTGDPISILRLEARPVATLSIKAQEKHEQEEKIKKD